jgi:hypothetical protein
MPGIIAAKEIARATTRNNGIADLGVASNHDSDLNSAGASESPTKRLVRIPDAEDAFRYFHLV